MSLSVACTSDSQEQRLLKQRRKGEIITFMFKWIRLSRSGLPLLQGESLVCMLSCIFFLYLEHIAGKNSRGVLRGKKDRDD